MSADHVSNDGRMVRLSGAGYGSVWFLKTPQAVAATFADELE
jgi:hypothetical protein